jgi:hypothetical protein
MLSEVMQRRYIMLMCLRCSNTLVTLHETEVAFHLRISDAEMAETKALFIAKGFIDKSFNLLNWEKRQFASDSSNTRVAKHRALQKEKQESQSNGDVTLQKRQSNALDTDTDTDKSNTTPAKADSLFTKFWETYPNTDRKQAKGKCLDAWKKAKAESCAAVVIGHVERLKTSNDWLKNNGEFIPAPLVYLNQRRWDGAVEKQSEGGILAGAI